MSAKQLYIRKSSKRSVLKKTSTFFCRSPFKRLALALSVVTLVGLPDELSLRQAGMQANDRLLLSTINRKTSP